MRTTDWLTYTSTVTSHIKNYLYKEKKLPSLETYIKFPFAKKNSFNYLVFDTGWL